MSKALVVVDMQNDFIDGALGSTDAQAIVPAVIEEIREKEKDGWDIYFTRDTHQPDYLKTLEGQKLPVEHCIKGTPGWAFNEAVRAAATCPEVIEKQTFGSEALAEILKNKAPEEIELLGLCTDICVLSNAVLLRAALPDTPIAVKENACAATTPEKQRAALEAMQSCQIDII